jgi:hypothetical protein
MYLSVGVYMLKERGPFSFKQSLQKIHNTGRSYDDIIQ